MTVDSRGRDVFPVQPELALETAMTLGSGLVDDAVWSGGRCAWVGAEPVELIDARPDSHPPGRLTYRALGPDLYAGTSGVALYLAQLAAVTGDRDARRTSLGALRHALSHTGDVEPHARLGFYVGWAGIGYAAFQVGSLLHVPEMLERGRELLGDVGRLVEEAAVPTAGPAAGSGHGRPEYDLVAGWAGAVVGLLSGHRHTGDESLLAPSVAAADQLVRSAHRHDIGWSWESVNPGNAHDLTGLSHGAAGVALALVEAYRVSGDESFAAAARQAMSYEDHWFDSRLGNWPDFRPGIDGGRSARRPRAFATLWCHGAPGIALARLHAYRHLGESRWLDDAAVAVRTSSKATLSLLGDGGANFSLCHGLAGNAECIREAEPELGAVIPETDVVARVAELGIERYATTGQPWPCGTHTEESPGLMLGVAGIGSFYLRMAEPGVATVLLPTNDGDAVTGRDGPGRRHAGSPNPRSDGVMTEP